MDLTKTQQKAEQKAIQKKELGEKLIPFIDKYGKEMIREFFDYWTEQTESHTKMRYEFEKVFNIPRRLATWKSRADKNSKPNYKSKDEERSNKNKKAMEDIAELRKQRGIDENNQIDFGIKPFMGLL